VIIYSRQTNRPIGAGVIVSSTGVFITTSDIINNNEQAGKMYALVLGNINQ
jgi:hypothetical protein